MNIAEFRASKRWCDDLSPHVEMFGDARLTPGWLYSDTFFIAAVTDAWPQASREKGKWYLVIGNREWIEDDLAALEARLWNDLAAYELDGTPDRGPVHDAELADEALNAACALIQERLGVTDGGLAAHFFSDNDTRDAFIRYIRSERAVQHRLD